MTLTILFDLDDTLLNNDIDSFLPVYLKALGKHMAAYVPPDRMVKELLSATGLMLTNDRPTHTLETAFDSAFYPAIGHSKENLHPVLNQFYDEVFPGLNGVTSQRPEAIWAVDWAKRCGHTMVVATNPLFPRSAIWHRIAWAGLKPQDFALITTYERMHFAKPNPAYVAEILAQLGWPTRPAVMVGNSLQDDLQPAAALGLPVFWVSPQGTALPQGFHPLSSAGTMGDLPAWLEKADAAAIRPEFNTPAALLAVLKSTAAALDVHACDWSPLQWQARPGEGAWNATEIMYHLRDVDIEVNLPRIDAVLNTLNPFVAGVDADAWAAERGYAQRDPKTALAEFITARSSLIDRLQSLTGDEWQRTARHAIFGPTTMQELVTFITTHDRTHVQQALMAAGV